MRKFITTIIILAILAGAGYGIYYWRAQQAASLQADWQTVPTERGELVAMIGATGVVHSNQNTVLTWQTTGTVEEVNVKIGDTVEVGQELASLEQTSLPQNVILAQVDLINAQKTLQNLLEGDPLAVLKALQAVSQAEQALLEAERAYDRFEDPSWDFKLEQAQVKVDDALEVLEEARQDLEPYLSRATDDPNRQYFEDRLAEAQNAYDEAVRRLEELKLQEKQAGERVELAKAQLTDVQAEYDRLKAGADAEDVAIAEARIAAAQATLNLARIAAPFDGTITGVQTKPGDRGAPGTVAFLIDDLSRLLVDVKVSEVDIIRIKLGQETILSFDAILGKEYHGVVTEVARVGTSSQGVVDFVVEVELTDADADVLPGMTAAVSITVDRLENVLLVPNRAVRVMDGQRVVYVLRQGEPIAVNIVLGASSDIVSEVLEGELNEGDLIVLNPPVVFEGEGGPPFMR